MSEDPFTSVQWDRDDKGDTHRPQHDSIAEEDSPSNSLLLAGDNNDSHQSNDEPGDELGAAAEETHVDDTELAAAAETAAPEEHNEGANRTTSGTVGTTSGTAGTAGTACTAAKSPTASVASPAKATSTPNASMEGHEVAPLQQQQQQQQQQRQLAQDIADQKRMEEQFAKYTILCEVSNPISDRDSNAKLYISYLVTTTTNHPAVKKLLAGDGKQGDDAVTTKVRRRYGDFRFLHDCLINDFPQLLVPPLPPKLNFKYLTGDTFSTAFVHKRLHSLGRFVAFIALHKLLSQLAIFHYFISDSPEWATFTKNLKISKGEDGDQLVVGKVVNEDLLTETVMNFFTSLKHKRETNKDILEISDKLKKLYENLVKLDKIFAKLNRKNGDLKSDYEQFLTQIDKLAAVQNATASANDSGVFDANKSLGSIDMLGDYANNFKVFSESLLYFSNHWAELHQYIDESFLVSLKDCAKYIVRFSDLIELQHNKKIDLQVLQDYLAKARNDLASLGGGHANHVPPPNPVMVGQSSGGLVNNTTQLIKDTLSTLATAHIGSTQSDQKKYKLQQKIQQLEGEITVQTQMVNSLTSRIINEEYPNWDRFNKKQLKQSMVELCNKEITFYKGLVDNWSDVEVKLMKRLDELK